MVTKRSAVEINVLNKILTENWDMIFTFNFSGLLSGNSVIKLWLTPFHIITLFKDWILQMPLVSIVDVSAPYIYSRILHWLRMTVEFNNFAVVLKKNELNSCHGIFYTSENLTNISVITFNLIRFILWELFMLAPKTRLVRPLMVQLYE